MKLYKLDALTSLAALLATIGALNWGFTGLLNFNLVRRVFGKAPVAERAVYGLVGLAGAWMAVQLAVPKLTIALSGRRRRPSMAVQWRSIVGQRLPAIEGRALSGRRVRLPDDISGQVALLTMGFAYDARWDVEAWVDAFHDRFGDRTDVTVFEMPMIGGIARLAAPMIEAGMRSGTPVDLYDKVVTIYASMGPIREALGAGAESDTWVYLVGNDGKILFQCAGGWDEAKFAQLSDALAKATTVQQREVGGT